MDCKKKYEDAPKRAKDVHTYYCDDREQLRKIESIFPELKESEEEKIRKKLIHLVYKSYEQGGYALHKDEADEMLTWLEKQGEQKPADKVEAKFKVGDWLQYRNAKPFLVEEITKQGYVNGDSCLPFNWENEIHLWTIQDAKDGDVLYSLDSNQPFIYKERKLNEQAIAYCGLNIYGKFFVWGTKDCIITLSNYVPATKEERDALFAKMKEASYEFDFENKELKEIHVIDEGKSEIDYCFTKMMNDEKVSPTCIEEDEEYNGEDYGIDSLFHAKRILEKTIGKVDGYQSDDGILEHKCAITAVKKLYEQKPAAWSEEDENRMKKVMYILSLDGRINNEELKSIYDWLKSLKPQKSAEWSEEDEELYQDALDAFEALANELNPSVNWGELYDWLKSLKQRIGG